MSDLRELYQRSARWVGQDNLIWLAGGALLIGSAVVLGDLIGQEQWLYLAALAGLIVACLWPIEIGLGFYAFLLPFNSVSVIGDAKSGTTLNWAVGALAAIALLSSGIIRKRLTFPPRAALLWLAFLFWSMVTILWSVQLQASLKQLPTSIAVVALYILAVSWRVTEKQFSFVMLLSVAGGLLASGYVIYLFESGITYRNATRASLLLAGHETNPDILASDFMIPLSLAMAGLLTARSWLGKTVSLVAAATIGYAILLSMSRASLVAIVAMMAVYLLRLGATRRLLAVVSVMALSLVALPSVFFSRIRDAIQTGGAGRFDIWIAGLTILKRYWTIGAGMATFPVVYDQYAGLAPVFRGFGRGSHNTLLEVGVELGIFGLFLLGMALVAHFTLVRHLRPGLREVPVAIVGLEAACWAMFAISLSADILWSKPFWLAWMLFLMAINTSKKAVPKIDNETGPSREYVTSAPNALAS